MAYQCLGTPVTAYLVITLLTWAAVSVSGITQELSTTAGDTVNIPCPFGEGTLSKILIHWYFNNGIGHPMILDLVNGSITIKAEYANRASLSDNYSTLILREITVADEGTYLCIVDTRKETAASITKTKLNVFSLHPNTVPVISPCTRADDSSSCSIRANQPFILTCTLPNVYPVKDTELIWYKGRKKFSSIHDDTQNDDKTTDIIRQIKIYETGYFTCNATYNSATGKENTAVAVEAWIIPPTDPPNPPGKNLTSSLIACMTICFVLFVVFSIAIALFLYFFKTRGQRSSKTDELNRGICNSLSTFVPMFAPDRISSEITTEASELLNTSPENGFEDRKDQAGRSAENGSEDGTVTTRVELNQPGRSAENVSEDGTAISTEGLNISGRAAEKEDKVENVDSPARPELSSVRSRHMNSKITDEMLFNLARQVPSKHFVILSHSLGITHNRAQNTMLSHRNDNESATMECLVEWRNRKQRSVADLYEVIRAAGMEWLIKSVDVFNSNTK